MKTADEMRDWAYKIKRTQPIPAVIEFCEAVIEYIGKRRPKSAEQRRRDRNDYQRNYMRRYRSEGPKTRRIESDMGDFSED